MPPLPAVVGRLFLYRLTGIWVFLVQKLKLVLMVLAVCMAASLAIWKTSETDASPPNASPVGLLNDQSSAIPRLSPESEQPAGYVARVSIDSPEEVRLALLRAEQLYNEGLVKQGDASLAIVLHGPEVDIFLKHNYDEYKHIVDLAAKLSAFEVLDLKVCEARLGSMGEQKEDLLPFVGTVPFGPREIKRLVKKEDYVYF